jgi:myo-inositol-1(or 4)-monophosphatase
MTSRDISRRFLALSGLALEAGALALRHFHDRPSLGVTMKGAQDYLTVADGAVEELLRRRIDDAFPGDAVLGEEGGGTAADRLWIVDPIDGTANFARGLPIWCVSIGYVQDGVPEFGAIFAPALEELYLGRRGGGATRNGAPIRASATADLAVAMVEIGWNSRRPLRDYLGMLERAMKAGANARRSAGGALGLAYTADGRVDAYAESHINSWDVAAGIVIAREAGCWVSDFFAGEALLRGNPILAAAPGIAAAMREVAGI